MMDQKQWAQMVAKYPARDMGNGNVRTSVCRLSYAHLFKPSLFKGVGGASDPNAKPRYSVTCLFHSTDTATALVHAMQATLREKFGPSAKVGTASGNKMPVDLLINGKPGRKTIDWPLLDQGIRTADGYTPGSLCIAAHAYSAPKLFGADGKPTADEQALYSGCYAFVMLRPYWSDKWGRLCISLEAVRKFSDGERFGGRTPVDEDDFGDVDPMDAVGDDVFA